jgi:two-component system sensor histidine kinase and response regulator WspE
MSQDDFSNMSMLELFRLEADTQTLTLTNQLLELERDPQNASAQEAAMRAAHSLKGAARIVGLHAGVIVAHHMEDCLVAAQNGRILLTPEQIDSLLSGVDLLTQIARTPEAEQGRWTKDAPEVLAFLADVEAILQAPADVAAAAPEPKESPAPPPLPVAPEEKAAPTLGEEEHGNKDRSLRVTASNLNRLLGLAAQTRIDARHLPEQLETWQRLKRVHDDVYRVLDDLRLSPNLPGEAASHLDHARQQLARYREQVVKQLTDLDAFSLRLGNNADRLYHETLSIRMRPFSDGVQGFPRLARDLGRQLGKEARLIVAGATVAVDREVLERLEAPLTQLIRNAVDHGLEPASTRQSAGKSPTGTITLEARHHAGRLEVIVSDDGRGIDFDHLRGSVVARRLSAGDTVKHLTETELLEFLFLPGFSMKEHVTEISGRGVGLDVVRNTLRELRGTIRVHTELGKGTRFVLTLPLTLSIVRVLLVEITSEVYAFPLAALQRTLQLPVQGLLTLEGRPHFQLDDARVALLPARQVLGFGVEGGWPELLNIVVIGSGAERYGLIVDRFLAETELVVQPLDARLGKVQDISAGGLTEDGQPVLIFDVEDLLRSVERLAETGSLANPVRTQTVAAAKTKRRILVVDDSLTVRELERKLLLAQGYHVEVAVDGMDGWNAVRAGHFDLVLSDVDMPRINGIELVKLIKRDSRLRQTPVMIVSYKDREEDRRAGLEAGADYYLTKGSFHDDTLLQAVHDLIGPSTP